MKSTIIPIYESDYSSDDNNNIHSDINPSCIIKNDDTNYETASDDTGYDENIDYKVISMRKPSFIRNTLTKFRKSVDEQTNFNSTMIGSTLIPVSSRPSFYQRIKRRIYIPIVISISLILTGVVLLTA